MTTLISFAILLLFTYLVMKFGMKWDVDGWFKTAWTWIKNILKK